jgi:hypothetical protein
LGSYGCALLFWTQPEATFDLQKRACDLLAGCSTLRQLPGGIRRRLDIGTRSHPDQATHAFRAGRIEHRHGGHREGEWSCFTGSIASPTRPDAWRCSSGNGILDPCYQRILGDEKQLACPVGGPWPANVVMLTLSQPLPSEPRKEVSRESTLPWALELANGQRCTMFTGATAPVAGMRINYGCPGGFQAVGDIDRSQPVWRVLFQGEKSIALEQVDIAVAWF